MAVYAPPISLRQLVRLHHRDCLPMRRVLAETRRGSLPGVEPVAGGSGFAVIDRNAALAAIRKRAA